MEWNDSRGYGFVVTHGTQRRIFLHVRHLAPRYGCRPRVGDILTYVVKPGDRDRPMADEVEFPKVRKPRSLSLSRSRIGFVELVLLLFVLLLGWLERTGKLPWFVIPGYFALGAATFLFYRHDKRAALLGRWRIRESTLQWLALLGGWPGALLAQKYLRHKSGKFHFQVVFWLVTLLHLAGVAWLSRR